MPRTARTIIPDFPHHVTQRGNRRMPVFFRDSDYTLYIDILAEQAQVRAVKFWAYCLMANHVHLIAVPSDIMGMSLMFREAHRRYTAIINRRESWTGHLWQDRYASFVMDEPHALMAARYIENNPVHAGVVATASHYRWSSAAFHIGETQHDRLITPGHPLQERVADWRMYLADGAAEKHNRRAEELLFHKHEKSRQPLLRRTGSE